MRRPRTLAGSGALCMLMGVSACGPSCEVNGPTSQTSEIAETSATATLIQVRVVGTSAGVPIVTPATLPSGAHPVTSTLRAKQPEAPGVGQAAAESDVALVLDGRRAFAARGRSIATLDLSSPLYPTVAHMLSLGAESQPSDQQDGGIDVARQLASLAVAGDVLLAAEYGGNLHVLDVSGGDVPEPIAEIVDVFPVDPDGSGYIVRDMVHHDGSLFIGADRLVQDSGGWSTERGRVVQLDVTKPSQPVLIAKRDMPLPIDAVRPFRSGIVVATSRGSGVANPHQLGGSRVALLAPRQPGLPTADEFTMRGGITSVATTDDWIYVVGYNVDDTAEGFTILALTSEEPPIFRELSATDLPRDIPSDHGAYGSFEQCCEARAHAANVPGGDLSPAPICHERPADLVAWDATADEFLLAIGENYSDEIGVRGATCEADVHGLRLFSLANPSHPEQVASLRTGIFFPKGNHSMPTVAIAGDVVYLMADDGRLTTIDVSNPSTPQQVHMVRVFGP